MGIMKKSINPGIRIKQPLKKGVIFRPSVAPPGPTSPPNFMALGSAALLRVQGSGFSYPKDPGRQLIWQRCMIFIYIYIKVNIYIYIYIKVKYIYVYIYVPKDPGMS